MQPLPALQGGSPPVDDRGAEERREMNSTVPKTDWSEPVIFPFILGSITGSCDASKFSHNPSKNLMLIKEQRIDA